MQLAKVFTVRNPKPSFGFFLQAGAHKELRNAKKPSYKANTAPSTPTGCPRGGRYLRVGFKQSQTFSYGLPPLLRRPLVA